MSAPQINHYFAYGSNMDVTRVAQRGLQVHRAYAGRLPGYSLTFNKMSKDHAGVGHATIEYSTGGEIEGVLYTLTSAGEILKMDPFERAPWNYGREVVQVNHAEGQVWAWTYFANPAVLHHDLVAPKAYLDHLLAGREFLSEAYFSGLLAWQDRAL